MSSNYYFYMCNDYRQGPSLDVIHSDDEDCDTDTKNEADLVTELPKPTKKYAAYVIEDIIGDYNTLATKQFKSLKNAKKYLLQAYCKANECTPFIVTGMTSGYKDTGSYGPEIDITHTSIKKLDFNKIDDSSNVYGLVITKDGSVCDTLCITPSE